MKCCGVVVLWCFGVGGWTAGEELRCSSWMSHPAFSYPDATTDVVNIDF